MGEGSQFCPCFLLPFCPSSLLKEPEQWWECKCTSYSMQTCSIQAAFPVWALLRFVTHCLHFWKGKDVPRRAIIPMLLENTNGKVLAVVCCQWSRCFNSCHLQKKRNSLHRVRCSCSSAASTQPWPLSIIFKNTQRKTNFHNQPLLRNLLIGQYSNFRVNACFLP